MSNYAFGSTRLDPRVTAVDTEDSLGTEFSKGLRGAGNAIGGQLQSLAGLTAENLGADEFAADRRASAAEYMQDANELNEGAIAFKDIGGTRDALRWGARTAGAALPYLGASIAGTVIAKNPFIGSAAPMVPISAGSIVQRQEADPAAMQADAGSRLRDAALGGLAAGAVSSLPFGVAAGKVASGALMGVGKNVLPAQSLLGAVGKNVGQGAATGGAGMFTGDVIEQSAAKGFDRVNLQESLDAGIEGAAMGGMMGAPFIPGSYMRGRGEQTAGAGKAAWDKTADTVSSATDSGWKALKSAGDAASKMSKGAWDTTKDVMPEGMKDYAEQAAKFTTENFKTGAETARQWAKDIAESDDLPADIKAGVAEAAKNVRDKTRFATVATAKFMQDQIRAGKTETKVEPKAPDPLSDLNRMNDVDRTDEADMASMAKGEPIGGIKPEYSTMDPQTLTQTLNEKATQAAGKVKKWTTDMVNDHLLDEGERQRAAEWAENAGDQAVQKTAAAAASAWNYSKKFGTKLDNLRQNFGKNEDGAKRSEDLTGFENALRGSVIPYISKTMPELFSNTRKTGEGEEAHFIHTNNFNKTTEVLQRTMIEMSQGSLSSSQMARLIDTFGEHTMPVMERLMTATGRTLSETGRVYSGREGERTNGKGARGENNAIRPQLMELMMDREGKESDPFTQQFLELARLSNKHAEATQIVRQALTPEYQHLNTDEVNGLVKSYGDWADGNHLSRMIGSRAGRERQADGYPKTGDMFAKPKAASKALKDPGLPVDAGKTEGGIGADGVKYPAGESLAQTAAGRYKEEGIRKQFAAHFGENADAVARALEERSARKFRDEPTAYERFDADGNRIEEAEMERVVRGGGWKSFDKNGEGNEIPAGSFKTDRDGKMIRDDKRVDSMVRDPGKFYAEGMKGFNKTHQLIIAMEGEFPAHSVKWEQTEGAAKGWGHVVAERQADPDKLSHADLANMRADTSVDPETRQARSRKEDLIVVHTSGGARIELDSLRSAWAMEKKAAYVEGRGEDGMSKMAKDNYKSDEAGPAQRMAQAALEAGSRIIDTFGSKKHPVVINPEARVGILGTDAKGNKTYMLWKDVPRYMNGDVRAGEEFRMQRGSAEQQAVDSQYTSQRDQDAKDRQLTSDGRPSDNLVKQVLQEEGKRGTNKDDNIHMAAGDRSARELRHTSNEDGTASTSFKMLTKEERVRANALTETMDKWYQEGPHADEIVAKTQILMKTALSAMSAKDLREFLNLRNLNGVARAEKTIDRLYTDYFHTIPEESKNPTQPMTVTKGLPKPVKPGVVLKNGKPVTVKTEVKYGEPLGLAGTQTAMEKLTAKQAQSLGDAALRRDLGKELITKDGRFYIEDRGDSAAVRFAPVGKAEKKPNFVGSAKREALGPTPTYSEGPFVAGSASKEMPQTLWEGSPDPKALAAKKAALVSKAASGDRDLFRELSTSTDAKGLQRAVDALNEHGVGKVASRLTGRVAMHAKNEFMAEYNTIANSLLAHMTTGAPVGKEAYRAAPDVAEAVSRMMAARLTGNKDAIQAINKLTHIEHQMFSMQGSIATNKVIREALTSAKKRTVGDYMDMISNSNDVPLILREVARKVGEAAGDVQVIGSKQLDYKNVGQFSYFDNEITMNNRMGTPAQTLLHESVHAATLRAIAKDSELNKAFYDLMEHATKHDPRLTHAYGMTNSAEFLAEGMSNRGLQRSLEMIPASDALRKYLGDHVANAWQGFVGLIRNALNMHARADNALVQFMELAGHAMKRVRDEGKTDIDHSEVMGWLQNKVVSADEFGKTLDAIRPHVEDTFRTQLDEMKQQAEADHGVSHTKMYNAELGRQVLEYLDKHEGGILPERVPTLISNIMNADAGSGTLEFPGVSRAIDTANKRLSELAKDPDVAYAMLTKKYSLGANNGGPHGPIVEAEMRRLTEQMLGNQAELRIEGIPHAGDFMRDHQRRMDVLRVSTTAFDPLGTLHHEALHAFFGHLRNAAMNDVTKVLEKYSASAHIMDQLRARLSPEALKQLSDPEERAAYMFQLYKTDPTFKLMPATRNLFGKISDFLHNVMGIWTNHQRAQHIMDYFQRGEFKTDMGNMPGVHAKLMEVGRNAAVEKFKQMAEPISRLGDSIAGMGGERLRDTGIPALTKIADLVKATGLGVTNDRGYLPAAREERSQRLNTYAKEMQRYTADEHRQALEAMQGGTQATGRARAAQLITEKTLDSAFEYMKDKGVDIGLLQDPSGAHYFPRVWDAHFISKNKDAFINMMEKYTRSGQFAGDPRDVMKNIMSSDGNSFNIVTRQPGLQFKKERLLRFIDHADAAPFLQKDLMVTMDSYITQGSRRAEWAHRFGDDAGKLNALLDQARAEGATDQQIQMTETYLKGVGGTLGDQIDPHLRRLQGNTIIYQNLRLLPLAVFSSLVDPIGIAVRGGTAGDAFKAFKRGFAEIPEGFRAHDKRKGSPEERTAELLGVIDDAYLHSSLGALYNQGMVGEFGRNLNDKFFKYNLMEQYNRSMRSSATAAAIKFIETHADGTASKKHSTRWMQELGLEPGSVPRKADGSLKLFESDGLSVDEAARIRQAVNQWVDGAVLRPDAVDKPMWMNDPHWALVAHLKQFTWSFQQTILKRVGHEYQHGNTGPAMALASYIPMMIAADAAKGMIQGAGSQPSWKEDWGPEEYFASGIQRAGLLGVGQYPVDALSSIQRGGTGLGVLAGPSFEQLGEAVTVIGGQRQFSSFALRSLPANSVYADWVRNGGGSSEPDAPQDPRGD